jgi:hypothetical protein
MEKKSQNTQKTSVYFTPELHATIQKSAEKHRRSFNQELLWLIEQGLRVEQYLDSETVLKDVAKG